jgi:hypothetical protein
LKKQEDELNIHIAVYAVTLKKQEDELNISISAHKSRCTILNEQLGSYCVSYCVKDHTVDTSKLERLVFLKEG